MRKDHQGLPFDELRQQALLVGQRLERVEIEAHNPGIRQVPTCRNEVGDEARLLALRFNPDALDIPIVSRDDLHTNTRDHLLIALQKFRLGLGRPKEFLDIVGAVALRGI